MKKLCLGTYLTIIDQARVATINKKNFLDTLLRCVNADISYLKGDSVRQNHLRTAQDDIPEYYAEAIRDADPESIYDYFKKEIRPILSPKFDKHVILAFRQVIREDTDIPDTLGLGPTTGYTKSNIITKNTFSYMGLLTNLYIYCVTQVKNKPYRANVKEIHDNYVASFDTLIDSIQIDEKISTIATPLNETAKRNNFDAVFTEIKHPYTLSLVNPSQVRIYHLNLGDYAFDFSMLSKFIKDNLSRYVFSRAKRNEYVLNEDENIGLDAANALKKRGIDPDDAHFAEIMLYSFLECALGAPKIMSKIELQNIGGEYRSKSSGVHLLSIPGKSAIIHQLVFGSTDVLADLHGAVDSAFAQVMDIKNSAIEEHALVETNIFNHTFDDDVVAFLKETIIPQRNKPKRPDTAFGLFLGYNVNIPDAENLPSEEYLPALIKKMQSDIADCVPYIQDKINSLKLSTHSFYIFVLPLNDVSHDRLTIMNKALGV